MNARDGKGAWQYGRDGEGAWEGWGRCMRGMGVFKVLNGFDMFCFIYFMYHVYKCNITPFIFLNVSQCIFLCSNFNNCKKLCNLAFGPRCDFLLIN